MARRTREDDLHEEWRFFGLTFTVIRGLGLNGEVKRLKHFQFNKEWMPISTGTIQYLVELVDENENVVTKFPLRRSGWVESSLQVNIVRTVSRGRDVMIVSRCKI